MALALGAAQVPSLAYWLSPGLNPQANQAYRNVNPRDTTGNSTVNMFLDARSNEFEYAASIVAACADQTVYALQRTGVTGQTSVGSETCGPNAGVSYHSFSISVSLQNL